MVRKKEIELLKRRALNFLRIAKELFKKEIFDISAFNLKQFCQLYLKYKLLIKIGEFPKTHSVRDLLLLLGKVSSKENRVKKFLSKNVSLIKNLENAYITSRYIPIEFEKDEVKGLLKFAKDFKNFVDKL
ncbi:MAG: DNA-binding protein [Candidatus Aenigmatarchaeota archaeon]|nr:MAG: DNA-binding protein [Candidatus Aenigmarchaeota archaeon]